MQKKIQLNVIFVTKPVLEIRTVFRAVRRSFENKGGSRIWLLQILDGSFKFGSQMRILIIFLSKSVHK